MRLPAIPGMPGMAGSHENWGNFKCHKWGEYRRHSQAQVIVAHGLDAKQSDQHQLEPIADAIQTNLGKKPTQLSADAGYCSDANLAALEEREIDAYIAPGGPSTRGRRAASPPCKKSPAGMKAPIG